MEIIHAEKIVDYEATAVALGNFDGLHIAHMRIIRDCVKIARERGIKSGVLLFEENTKSVAGKKPIELITTNEQKLKLLSREKLDFVYVRQFTEEFMRKSPEEFVQLLLKNLKAKIICVGYDYRFGHKAAGNVDTLRELGEKYGFEVIVTDKITIDGETVSSTHIRELVREGRVDEAIAFLGRRYTISGEVVEGLKNGRKMGLPTANVDYDKHMVLPKEGVYAGITEIDGERHTSVINVGKNLTFGAEKLTVESHILDFDEDIYGKNINVLFAKRLRGVFKFGSIDELKAQINRDKEAARAMNLIKEGK